MPSAPNQQFVGSQRNAPVSGLYLEPRGSAGFDGGHAGASRRIDGASAFPGRVRGGSVVSGRPRVLLGVGFYRKPRGLESCLGHRTQPERVRKTRLAHPLAPRTGAAGVRREYESPSHQSGPGRAVVPHGGALCSQRIPFGCGPRALGSRVGGVCSRQRPTQLPDAGSDDLHRRGPRSG